MQLIYVAAPYSHSDPNIVEQRMAVVSEYQAYFAENGLLTVSPVEKHFILKYRNLPGDYQFWGNLSRALLRRCDALYVIQLPGWRESTGVQDEIAIATHLNIPTKYFTESHYYTEVKGSIDIKLWK